MDKIDIAILAWVQMPIEEQLMRVYGLTLEEMAKEK